MDTDTFLGKRERESANFEREVKERVEKQPQEEFINLKLQKVNNPKEEEGPLFMYNPKTKIVKNMLGENIGKKDYSRIYLYRNAGNAYDRFLNSTEIITPAYVLANRQNWKEAVPGEIKPYFTPYIACSPQGAIYCRVFLVKGVNPNGIYETSMEYNFNGFLPVSSSDNVFQLSSMNFDSIYAVFYEAPPEIAEPYLRFLGIVNPTVMTLYALQNAPEREREFDPLVKSYSHPNFKDPVAVRPRGPKDSSKERSGPVGLDANTVIELAEYMGNSNALIGGKRKKRKSKRKCRRSRKRRTRRYRS